MESKYKLEKLGNYIEQIRGVSYKPTDVSDEKKEGYKVVLRANSIKDNKLILDDLVYVKDGLIKEKQLIKCNDILMAASSGSKDIVGKSVQIHEDTEYAFGAFCKLIRCSKDINPKYVAYFFRTPYYRSTISSIVCGANINNLKNEHIDNLLIPIIDKKNQEKIVEVLDKVEELINKRKEQIEALDELVKSKFIEMFGDPISNPKGWNIKTVEECCTLKSGTSLSKEIENEGGNIPYIKVGDMNCKGNEKYINTSTHFVSEGTAGNGIFEIGTVIFPKRGGAIGTNKKRLTKSLICADLNVMGVKGNNNIHPEYLYMYFINIDMNTLNNGSSVPQINNKDIAPLQIQVPPIDLQNKFADFVKKVDEMKLKMENSLKELEDNFNSLMQKAFKGELF